MPLDGMIHRLLPACSGCKAWSTVRVSTRVASFGSVCGETSLPSHPELIERDVDFPNFQAPVASRQRVVEQGHIQ